ncbi:hypothetical protein [Marinomonas sp.]
MIPLLVYIILLPAKAHTVNETSAQVILRAGQVEVQIITDMSKLLSKLRDHQAWLMGDIDRVMPANLSPEQQNDFIKKLFTDQLILTLNQQPLIIERVTLAQDTTHGHHHISKVVLQARHSLAHVSTLSMQMPKSLGEVHISVVRPQYRVINAGDKVDFTF